MAYVPLHIALQIAKTVEEGRDDVGEGWEKLWLRLKYPDTPESRKAFLIWGKRRDKGWSGYRLDENGEKPYPPPLVGFYGDLAYLRVN